MSEKYIDLRQAIFRDLRDRGRPIAVSIGDVLEWLDEHPDQVPGRAITQSRFNALSDQYHVRLYSFQHIVDELGITVVPDPEPTNAEKLAGAITNAAHGVGIGSTTANIKAIAEHLDAAGVRAGGDDE